MTTKYIVCNFQFVNYWAGIMFSYFLIVNGVLTTVTIMGDISKIKKEIDIIYNNKINDVETVFSKKDANKIISEYIINDESKQLISKYKIYKKQELIDEIENNIMIKDIIK